MSSEIRSILASIQLNDYATVSIATAVGYDFILTFINEIDHVWKRPWSWVSTLFILVRYVGCLNALCTVMNLISLWTLPVFLGASDLLMILRVYAMYNRSRRILAILLVIYILVMVPVIAKLAAYIMTEKDYLTVVLSVADVKFCVLADNKPLITTYTVIALGILGVLLCILAVAKFVRHSLEMHKAIKQWRSDQYMKLFARESILYFIANLLFYVVFCIPNFGTPYIVLLIMSGVFPYVLAPRFVLSVRELSHRYWVRRRFASEHHHVCEPRGYASGRRRDCEGRR
ncbi:hypothetical protein PAXINDRAFT_168608 [Paxillus involutus ATCC 200175]|nr:hypothetical protein PAXINDRAFT_168608 [Paxillus involutus ATCC 200175]